MTDWDAPSTWHFVFTRAPDTGSRYDLGRDVVTFTTRGVSTADVLTLAWGEVERVHGKSEHPRTLNNVTRKG